MKNKNGVEQLKYNIENVLLKEVDIEDVKESLHTILFHTYNNAVENGYNFLSNDLYHLRLLYEAFLSVKE